MVVPICKLEICKSYATSPARLGRVSQSLGMLEGGGIVSEDVGGSEATLIDGGIHMRSAVLALVGALGLATAAVSANAAQAVPSLPHQHSKIVDVSGGCGPGGHRGHCVHRYGWRAGDHSANSLNREELGRINSGN